MIQRRELLRLLRQLKSLEEARGHQGERDGLIGALNTAAPHANASDLIYWPERDRSDEEIADEILTREQLWLSKGDLALRERIKSQLEIAINDPAHPESHHTKVSARSLLEEIGRVK